jgi:hypothetical protein
MRPEVLRLKAVVSLVIGAKLPLRYAMSSAPCEGVDLAADLPSARGVSNVFVVRSI